MLAVQLLQTLPFRHQWAPGSWFDRFTMMGTRGSPGIFQLATEDLFASLPSAKEPLSVVVAFYEIYCGKLFDLLNSRQARRPQACLDLVGTSGIMTWFEKSVVIVAIAVR